jgi:hypothetical protein
MGGLKYLLTVSRLTYWAIIEADNEFLFTIVNIDDQTSLQRNEIGKEKKQRMEICKEIKKIKRGKDSSALKNKNDNQNQLEHFRPT